jgi:hypothetical protein
MIYRYPWRAMLPDYVRAVLGILCTMTPLILMDLSIVVVAVLVFVAMIFVLFAAQAVLRHATRILVSEREIRARPLGGRIAWDSLTRLKLAYFSLRRDGRGGWMELKMQSGRRTLRIDSRLNGFTEVARQAAAAARHACLDLDTPTLSNLATLDIRVAVDAIGESGMRGHG